MDAFYDERVVNVESELMKVLFVSSGNNKVGAVDNLTKAQGESLEEAGVEISYFTIKGKGIRGYYKSIGILKKELKERKFDIIHAHFGLCGMVAYFSRTNEKLVVSFMGDDLIGSVDKNGNYTVLSKLIAFFNSFFAKYFYDYNIVKSKNLFIKLWPHTKAQIIPNGVNFKIFYPFDKKLARTELNLKESAKIVLFAANPERLEKNFKLAEEAVRKLKDVELKVVYNITQAELNHFYNAADAVILSSLHEGSPNVIKEAMACNCPIVSTNVGDVKENIGTTEGCFVVDPNKDSMAEKIKEALLIGKTTGRENIKHLESSATAKKILEIYKTLLVA